MSALGRKIAHRRTPFHDHEPPTVEHHPDRVIIPAELAERRDEQQRITVTFDPPRARAVINATPTGAQLGAPRWLYDWGR
jgi:hypothetical protein